MGKVKKKNLNLIIKELEAKIHTLEEENTSLADEAEGTLLLSLVSESLDRHDNITTLLKNGLERIAILKNLPFCCCCSLEGQIVTPISSYIKNSNELNAVIKIQINNKIIKELDGGSGVINLSENKKIKIKFADDRKEFILSFILLIPFKTRFIPNGIFLFADENKSDILTSFSFVFQNMVTMIAERMDKLILQAELRDINHQLEERVEERTRELSDANERLKIGIAEKIKTEEALLSSEVKFRSITEQLSDVIFLTDSRGVINYISPSVENVFGWMPNEIVGKVFTEYLLESEIPKAYATFSKTLREKIDTKDLALIMKRKDGSFFYGELDATVYQSKTDYGTLGVIRDISERKHAEEELKKSESDYRNLFDNASDAIIIFEPETENILEVNNSACDLYGFSKSQFIGMSLKTLTKDVKQGEIQIQQTLRDRSYKNYESKQFTKDGKTIDLNINAAVIEYRGKEAILSINHDITDRKRVEEELYQRLKDRDALYKAVQHLQHLALPEDIAQEIIAVLEEMLGYTFSAVLLLDETNQKLLPFALSTQGYGKDFIEKDKAYIASQSISVDEGITGFVAIHGKSVRIGNVALDPRYKDVRKNIQSELCVPLRINDRIIGVINIESEHPDAYTESDQILLETVSAQIAIAIQNAQLYQEIKKNFLDLEKEIQERKRAEEAIRESEEKFRTIFNQSPIGIELYNADGMLIDSNKASLEMFGIPEVAETQNFNIFDGTSLSEETKEKLRRGESVSYQAIFNFEKVKELNQYKTNRSGKAYLDYLITPISSAGNKSTLGYLLQVQDISERKKAEEALRESEERFRSLYENSTIGLYRTTPDGRILLANPTLIKMLGYTSFEELSERDLEKNGFESSTNRKMFIDQIEMYGEVKGLESVWICKNGLGLIVKESARAIYDSNGATLYYDGTVEDITEHKKVEQALRESEEIFNQFMKHSPIYLFFKDDKIRSLRLSDNFEKMLGRPLNDLIGKTMEDLFPSDLARKMVEDDQRILREGKEVILDEELNGRYYTTIKFPIHVGGKPVYLAGFTIDVTERKKTEEEINMLAYALKSIDECVSITDTEDHFIFANQSFLKTYGYNQDELLGKKIDILRSPNNKVEIINEILPSTLRGGWNGELMNKRKDGSEFQIYLSTSVINDKEGKPLGLIGVAQDITGRKKVEQEIISQRNKLEQLIINSPVAIASMNEKKEIIDINESFTNLFGYSSSESVGRNIDDLVTSSEYKSEAEKLTVETYCGKSTSTESYRRKKDGSLVFVQIVGVPIQIQDQIIGTFVMYLDLTTRMLAEQEIIRSKEIAEQSDKMKSEFLAQMSHEIRTPINIIVSNIGFIKEQLEDKISTEDQECFNSINLASQRVIRTIELILSMSELQTGAYKPMHGKVDIDSQVLQYLFNEFQRTARAKGIDLIYRNEVKETEIQVDEYSIAHIFSNLIDNAIKYTKNGRIEILLTKNKNDDVIVEIKDTGIGINKDFLPHIFEPFVQEEQGYTRSYEGNGLGLSLVKKYCEINKADIEVESEKNIGSTFRVTFKKNI